MSRYIDADALECDTEWSEYHDGFISYSQLEIDTALMRDLQDWKDRMWAEAIVSEPQTDTEIAKAIVHKMIDDAVIAEDAYPNLRQKMHDAVDEYEPQTDCAWMKGE